MEILVDKLWVGVCLRVLKHVLGCLYYSRCNELDIISLTPQIPPFLSTNFHLGDLSLIHHLRHPNQACQCGLAQHYRSPLQVRRGVRMIQARSPTLGGNIAVFSVLAAFWKFLHDPRFPYFRLSCLVYTLSTYSMWKRTCSANIAAELVQRNELLYNNCSVCYVALELSYTVCTVSLITC